MRRIEPRSRDKPAKKRIKNKPSKIKRTRLRKKLRPKKKKKSRK